MLRIRCTLTKNHIPGMHHDKVLYRWHIMKCILGSWSLSDVSWLWALLWLTKVEVEDIWHQQVWVVLWPFLLIQNTVYIANRLRWKFCSGRTKLYFAGKHLQLDSSLAWPRPTARAISLEKFCGYRLICENCITLIFHLEWLQYAVYRCIVAS